MLVGVIITIINRTVKSAYMMHSWWRLFTVSHIEVNRFDPRTAISRRQSLFGESRRGYIETGTQKTRCVARYYKRLDFHKTSTCNCFLSAGLVILAERHSDKC